MRSFRPDEGIQLQQRDAGAAYREDFGQHRSWARRSQNSKALEAAAGDMAIVTGQKAVITKAKKSIATFKLREGMPIGVETTLRGDRMWDFLDRLINIVLPRQRDFQGVSADAFDGRGNYSLGLREQLVFPEINYDKVDKIRGLEVTIVTTAKSDEEARRMLALMSMPFKR